MRSNMRCACGKRRKPSHETNLQEGCTKYKPLDDISAVWPEAIHTGPIRPHGGRSIGSKAKPKAYRVIKPSSFTACYN